MNYVTLIHETGDLYRWQRVKGNRKGTSTTLIEGFDQACEVAKAIADCNGLKFLRPEF